MKTIQHHCPTLGAEIVAEEGIDSGIVFFRGIPYASVSERWTQSHIQNSLPSPFDATHHGPKCPQPAHISLLPVGPKDPIVEIDEFACLNLNVTTPLEALPERGQEKATPLIPVMVWVHGGAFKNGANSTARHHPQILSTLAKEAGHPIILVQINYRLGVFGFAASADLASEYSSRSSEPSSKSQAPDYFGNFGLVDQQNAFEWVRNHIKDFGGDPSNVTAFGVSAGSGSLHLHMLSGKPLFDRAILMSGTAPIMGPTPLKSLESGWTKLCKNSNLLDHSSEIRLEKLRSLTSEELVENYGASTTSVPLGDGKLLPESWTLGESHPDSRCKDIIIGDTGLEGIIFDGLSRVIPQDYFRAKALAVFATASDAEIFFKYFGFVLGQPYEEFRDAMRFFLSVVLFQFPTLRVAETYGGNAYLYHFEEPSPYPGPTYGFSVHAQCALFLFNNDRGSWPESAQKTAVDMANLWTAFAYGKAPWELYQATKRFMRFGPSGEGGLKAIEDDETRNYEYLGWLREHFEETRALIQSFS